MYVCVCGGGGGCLESIAGVPASMWDSGIGSSPLQFAEAFQKLLMCLSFSGLSKRLLSSSQKQVDRELWSSSQSCWTAVLNLSPLISLDGCKVSGGACGTSCPLSLTQATYPCPIPMPDTQQGMHRYTEIQGYVPHLFGTLSFPTAGQQPSSPNHTLALGSHSLRAAPPFPASLSLPISAASIILVPQSQKHPMPPKSLPL